MAARTVVIDGEVVDLRRAVLALRAVEDVRTDRLMAVSRLICACRSTPVIRAAGDGVPIFARTREICAAAQDLGPPPEDAEPGP